MNDLGKNLPRGQGRGYKDIIYSKLYLKSLKYPSKAGIFYFYAWRGRIDYTVKSIFGRVIA